MVDLSQDKPLKSHLDDSPASDEPPVTSTPPVSPPPPKKEPPLPKDKPPLPSVEEKEKIDTPQQEEIKKELSELGISPKGGSKKTKILLATLGVLLLIATLPAAVYLVRQRQEIRKEAANQAHNFTSSDWTVGGPELKGTHANHEITVGPGPIDFVASGFGMKSHKEGTIRLEIPEGASIERVFAFWAGQKAVSRDRTNRRDQFCECRMQNMAAKLNQDALHCQIGIGKTGGSRTTVYPDKWNIFVHDNPPNCCNGQDPDNPSDSCKTKISERDCPAYGAYFAEVTNVIKQKFPGNPTVLDISVGDMHFYSNDPNGSGEGAGIVLVYRKQGLSETKIKVKLWGQFIIRARTDNLTFNLADIDTTTSNKLKAVFFLNEAEAGSPGSDPYDLRPNYLYYNGQNLAPTDNTTFVGFSVEDPYSPSAKTNNVKWWDTRITGINLPEITYKNSNASFNLWSPNSGQAPSPYGKYMGDSIGLVGGVIQYVTGPGEEPPNCWETCTTDPECPKEPQVLTCQEVQGIKRCVNPNCISEENCTCPLTYCVDLTSTPPAETLGEDDEVQFTCKGTSGIDNPINRIEFRVQIDEEWQDPVIADEVTEINGEYEGKTNYTIPQTGNYRTECRVCTSQTECTQWGKAEMEPSE